VPSDLSLLQEHLEYLVPENGLQLFEFQRQSDAEHSSLAIEVFICDENVAVRIEPERAAECLDSNKES